MITTALAGVILSLFPTGLPAAIAEDSCATGVRRCVWDAQDQGNERGRSYILTGDHHVTYITHRAAARLTEAYCARPTVACGYAN